MDNKLDNSIWIEWKNLIYKVAKKYINRYSDLDLEDLVQIGCIGLMHGIRNYNNDIGVPKVNYLAKCIGNEINKEFQSRNYNKRKVEQYKISSNDTFGYEDDLTIEDTIIDPNVDIEKEVQSNLLVEYIYNCLNRYLDKLQYEVMYMKIHNNKTMKEIGEIIGITENKVRSIVNKSKQTLYRKDRYMRETYDEVRSSTRYRNVNLYRDSVEHTALFTIQYYQDL